MWLHFVTPPPKEEDCMERVKAGSSWMMTAVPCRGIETVRKQCLLEPVVPQKCQLMILQANATKQPEPS